MAPRRGNQTPISRVTGGDDSHYTTEDSPPPILSARGAYGEL